MNLANTACTRPPEDWGLDPLFWVPAKLFIGDLLLAMPSELTSVYFVGNQHIIRSVEIVGIVVSVNTRSLKLTVYHSKLSFIKALCMRHPLRRVYYARRAKRPGD
ncbi:hypothetical protein IWW57_001713 [Coemansia sp. S610]|nr:hypothetical protein IWW57_001713 [Coemansia sp. S610]